MGLFGKSGTLRVTLAVLAALAALSLTTCGSKHAVVQGFSPGSSPGNKTSPEGLDCQETDSLDDALTELDVLEAPDGADAALFAQLKDVLREALNDSCKAGIIVSGAGVPPVIQVVRRRDACATKLISTPPTGEANRVDDLELTDNGDGTFTLSWHYKNLGDYDQNGIVGIEDIIPLAEHYNETWVVGEEDTLPAVIDGSGNGVVDIADITPIARNLALNVHCYTIEGAETADGSWEASGFWGTPDGVVTSPSATETEPSGTENSPEGTEVVPAGIETSPKGIEDIGGGYRDALVMKLDPSEL